MLKLHKNLPALLILILVTSCSQSPEARSPEIPSVAFGSVSVAVEIADTPEKLQQGLMHRTSLPEGMGMLFIFPDEKPRAFWMKNTLIPLDMIHISEKGTVVDVITAEPCIADPCRTYPSNYPAKYVLEVNAGFAARNGIEKGSGAVLRLE